MRNETFVVKRLFLVSLRDLDGRSIYVNEYLTCQSVSVTPTPVHIQITGANAKTFFGILSNGVQVKAKLN